ncbi:DUF998 domain-containing protein [Streptomyces sp. NPDC090023]|uniref:DUF998 domain-containing protein n=1 Tax=unclassified Streptomyces TaxID=2593676 RepID=UPI00380D04E1
MTDMLTASPHALSVAPASRSASRWCVAGGVVAGPLFLTAGLVQGSTRDGFDHTRNAISQLALGDAGWIQTANFVLTGALLLVGAIGLRGMAVLAGFMASAVSVLAFTAGAGLGLL